MGGREPRGRALKRLPLVGQGVASRPAEAGAARVPVSVLVVGAVEDGGALRFASALAETLGGPVARREADLSPACVAVGESLAARVEPALCVVVGGTLPRAAWRASVRGLRGDLMIAEPREILASLLGERLRGAT